MVGNLSIKWTIHIATPKHDYFQQSYGPFFMTFLIILYQIFNLFKWICTERHVHVIIAIWFTDFYFFMRGTLITQLFFNLPYIPSCLSYYWGSTPPLIVCFRWPLHGGARDFNNVYNQDLPNFLSVCIFVVIKIEWLKNTPTGSLVVFYESAVSQTV